MRLALLLTLLAVAGTVTGCDSNDDDSGSNATSNTYAITFMGTESGEVARATIAFQRPTGTQTTTGTYTYVSGERLAVTTALSATAQSDGKIRVSLDPSTTDSGADLLGTFAAGTSTGTWSQSSVAGPVNRGTFSATRQ